MIKRLLLLISALSTVAPPTQHIIEKNKDLEYIEHCFPEVMLMDYSRNSISTVTNDTFSECTALQTIKLGYNKIHIIESGSFWNLQDLNYIVLSHNEITYLDQNIFENNKKLETVILSNNPLVFPQLIARSLKNLVCNFCKRIEVKQDTFAGTPNVESVSLVGTEVLPFDVKELTALHSLQEFIIKNKDSKGCFTRNEYPTLVLLQQNNVTLGPDVFCKVNGCLRTNLSLVCKHMYLKTIEPPTSNEIVAYYSYNSITTIGNESFMLSKTLKVLRLDHNLIENIESDAFRTLTNLQYIDLSHNKLEKIMDSIFAYNKNLLTVDFSHNSIIVPTLQSNSIEALACDFCKRIVVEEKTLLTMPNLKSLRLLGTEVDPFDENAAKSLLILREFELTRNDSRRCFQEKNYPGLVYLQKRGVILGDDVFCKVTNETFATTTNSPPEIKNASFRNKQYFLLLFFWFIIFILQ